MALHGERPDDLGQNTAGSRYRRDEQECPVDVFLGRRGDKPWLERGAYELWTKRIAPHSVTA